MASGDNPYAVVLVLALFALAFAVTPLILARLWVRFYAPAKAARSKQAVYECGLESKGDAWVPFRAQYYLYGILFLVFDVEALFLFPFAVAYAGLPTGAVVAMLIFLLLLVETLAWAWMKGILEWR